MVWKNFVSSMCQYTAREYENYIESYVCCSQSRERKFFMDGPKTYLHDKMAFINLTTVNGFKSNVHDETLTSKNIYDHGCLNTKVWLHEASEYRKYHDSNVNSNELPLMNIFSQVCCVIKCTIKQFVDSAAV